MFIVILIALVFGLMLVSMLVGTVFSLLWSLLIGLIVGSIAKFILPGNEANGLFITAFLGMGGSMFATILGRVFKLYADGQNAGFIASIIGALLLLFIYRMFQGETVKS